MNFKCLLGLHNWEYSIQYVKFDGLVFDFFRYTQFIKDYYSVGSDVLGKCECRFCDCCYKKQFRGQDNTGIHKWKKISLSEIENRDIILNKLLK